MKVNELQIPDTTQVNLKNLKLREIETSHRIIDIMAKANNILFRKLRKC